MGLLPDWSIKGSRPQGSFGQYTQNNMFTNPSYEQQGKPQQLANALRQHPMNNMQGQQIGMNNMPIQQIPNFQQPVAQNPMQPQPFQASNQNTNLMMGGNPQGIQNWNSQYGS